MTLPDERRHILQGPQPGESPGGVGLVEFVVRGDDAQSVRDRCGEVMLAVVDHAAASWPDVDGWQALLPDWFVAACAGERTEGEIQAWVAWWRSLPAEERVRVERDEPWSLADWVGWMHPDQREWFWWDANTESRGTLRVQVEVPGWPAALGALRWLLRTAGAWQVELDE